MLIVKLNFHYAPDNDCQRQTQLTLFVTLKLLNYRETVVAHFVPINRESLDRLMSTEKSIYIHLPPQEHENKLKLIS
jgi:hypothetical protein